MIFIFSVGKARMYAEDDAEYLKRMQRYCEVNAYRDVYAMADAVVRAKCDFLVLCDEAGAQYTSVAFAHMLDKQLRQGQKVIFCIAPAEGWGDSRALFPRAKLVSLSPLTFSHDLARHILIEQVYRAITIINGHPYHKA